jgi:DNA adenine methylase
MTSQLPPLLKYPGSSRKAADRLCHLLGAGPGSGRHFEPFAGSAAVFFHRASAYPGSFGTAWLSDRNPHLMHFLRVLRRLPRKFIRAVDAIPRVLDVDDYLRLRTEYRSAMFRADPARAAALVYVVNKHGFNGMHRVNSKGECNTPAGSLCRSKKPRAALDRDHVMACHRALQRAEIDVRDFGEVMPHIGEGDSALVDPPYFDDPDLPKGKAKQAEAYGTGRVNAFGPDRQQQLADLAWGAAARGARVVITNADTADARQMYRDMELWTDEVHRSISCRASTRGAAREVIAVCGPGDREGLPARRAAVWCSIFDRADEQGVASHL